MSVRKRVEAKKAVPQSFGYLGNGQSQWRNRLPRREGGSAWYEAHRRGFWVAVMMAAMLMLSIGPASEAATLTVKGSNMPTTQPCETSAQTNDGGGASFEDKKGGKWCYRQLP